MNTRATLTLSIAMLISVGCAPETETETEADTLSPERIEAAMAEYPRLGEDPLGEPEPNGDQGVPPSEVLEEVRGEATFYADKFEGRRTASGIPFRQNQFVAAHRDYPFGTLLRVTNLRNDESVNVRVVDRGPFGARSRIIDLSRRAANGLNIIQAGHAEVRVEVLEWGNGVPEVG